MYLACTSESYGSLLDAGRLSLVEWFRLCREELGIPAVELEDRHVGEPTPARVAEVREAAAGHGLEIVNIALMNNFGLADATKRSAEEARTLAWIQASPQIGTRFLRTFAGWPEGDRDARWPEMINALASMSRRAEAMGVRLVLENHNHHGFVQTADDVETILKSVNSPALGLLLDSGNFLDGMASLRRTARLAWHVHAKFTRVGPDGRDARVDNEGLLTCLGEAGYKGCLSIEYEGDEPSTTAVPRAVARLRSAIDA